jgi:GntR family transcriptional regulator/MocR family aminotransferase
MFLDLDGHGKAYEQLARALKRAILDGRVGAGHRLPPTRAIAIELGLSRNTVLTAYELLCAEGLTQARAGSGTYVNDVASPARGGRGTETATPQSRYAARLRHIGPVVIGRKVPGLRLDLQYGEPMVNLPLVNRWRSELGAAAIRASIHYPPAQGVLALREAISDHVARRRGVATNADDILIVSGMQQAISLVTRVLVDENDTIVVEDPHYMMASRVPRAYGARVVYVPSDDQGLVTQALPRRAPAFIFTTPAHQFPLGSVMSLARRKELLQYAADHRTWIFEDDYDAEFRYDSRPIPALRSLDLHGRVIHVGTFSKALFPSLRLGYIVCPPALQADLVNAKRYEDLGCSAIEQTAMATFMERGRFETHLRKATAELRRRRACLLDGIARHAHDAIQVPDSRAGMHAVGWLPGFRDAQLGELIELAAGRGLGLHSIRPHYQKQPPVPGLLLGFAGLSVIQLNAATRLLGACLREF